MIGATMSKLIVILLTAATLSFTQQPLGDTWLFLGDSQTAGRATEPSVASSAIAFENIYRATFSERDPYAQISGVGGCTLLESAGRYGDYSNKADLSLIHFQESGGQLKTGQRTPEQYVSVLRSFITEIQSASAQAVISVETAYSFQREAETGRDWTEYNRALNEHVETLKSQGVSIVLSDVDTNIKALVAQTSFNTVIMSDGGHYRGVGNLMVALSLADALGYSVEQLNLNHIPDNEVSEMHKNICLNIITESKSDKKGEPIDLSSWFLSSSSIGQEESSALFSLSSSDPLSSIEVISISSNFESSSIISSNSIPNHSVPAVVSSNSDVITLSSNSLSLSSHDKSLSSSTKVDMSSSKSRVQETAPLHSEYSTYTKYTLLMGSEINSHYENPSIIFTVTGTKIPLEAIIPSKVYIVIQR